MSSRTTQGLHPVPLFYTRIEQKNEVMESLPAPTSSEKRQSEESLLSLPSCEESQHSVRKPGDFLREAAGLWKLRDIGATQILVKNGEAARIQTTDQIEMNKASDESEVELFNCRGQKSAQSGQLMSK